MKKIAAGVAALAGGLLFWRRKTLKEDAGRVAEVTQRARARFEDQVIAKRAKYNELGHLVYEAHRNPDADNEADIERVLAEIDELTTDEPVRSADETIDLTESASREAPVS